MSHAKQRPLIPITREFLKQFYQRHPLVPVPHDARVAHLKRIEELADAVTKPGSRIPEQVGMPSPTRIDDCFWRNRMICEELALSILKLQEACASQPQLAAACGRCHGLLVGSERGIFAVQERNTASVKAQLQQFIPQDFRGALLERQRVSTEARYKKQVDDLVSRGGTIRQKYDLYLQQQWERRQALVQLGECSGMYKMVIKWVAGIPQVLLDFAKEINAKLGPMEEQRIKYGPDLYGITELGLRLDVCLASWAESASSSAATAATAADNNNGVEGEGEGAAHPFRLLDVVEPAVSFYCEHMLRVVRHIGDVFQQSPFFVNKDDLAGGGGHHYSDGSDGGGVAAEVEGPSSTYCRCAARVGGGEQQTKIPPDVECGSSVISAASASVSGDDCGSGGGGVAPAVAAPPTPGLLVEALPRAATMLSGSEYGHSCSYGGEAAAGTVTAAAAILSTLGERQPLLSRFDTEAGSQGTPMEAAAATVAVVAAAAASPQQTPPAVSTLADPKSPNPTPFPAAVLQHVLITATSPALQANGQRQQHQQLGWANRQDGGGGDGCSTSQSGAATTAAASPGHHVCNCHLSSDSHLSFVSALEHQPWHNPDEYPAAASTTSAEMLPPLHHRLVMPYYQHQLEQHLQEKQQQEQQEHQQHQLQQHHHQQLQHQHLEQVLQQGVMVVAPGAANAAPAAATPIAEGDDGEDDGNGHSPGCLGACFCFQRQPRRQSPKNGSGRSSRRQHQRQLRHRQHAQGQGAHGSADGLSSIVE